MNRNHMRRARIFAHHCGLDDNLHLLSSEIAAAYLLRRLQARRVDDALTRHSRAVD
jgi:hypothetical protein